MVPAGHVLPHAPQFKRSVVVSRHTPPQLVWPPPQLTVHALDWHTWPAGHVAPQALQFRRSVERSRQVPEQFVSPAPQLT
jgi:hypothetical protein